MSTIEFLKDQELNLKIKNLAAQERKLSKIIIEHIAEIDRRKLFLKMAYSSLFDYLTREIGYSAGAAQRRIDAARMFLKIPEVSNLVATGSLHLSQLSKVQQICRLVKKESGINVSILEQKMVLSQIQNQNARQTDLILAKQFAVEIKIGDKQKIQKDESVRIELTFTRDEMVLIEQAKSLLSNKTGGGIKDTNVKMAETVIQKNAKWILNKEHKEHKAEKAEKAEKNAESNKKDSLNSKERSSTTATAEVNAAADLLKKTFAPKYMTPKYMTPKLRAKILNRDRSCQYKDIKTGRICNSKYFLEVDHIKPKFAGGRNDIQNLRILCKNHNIFRYKNEQL
jgi:hypothetical protein